MVPIYVKTVYSFLSSTITIDKLISFAKEHNLDTLCICDDNMYGAMEFITKCQKNHIKPIVGLDIGWCLLYAKNYLGYQNLLKITMMKSKAELTVDDLASFKENLVCFMDENSLYKDELIKIFNDYYLYGKDNFPLNKTLCLDEKDLDTLKYLILLRDNKTLSDDYDIDENVVYVDNDDKRIQEFVLKCDLKLPKYELNLPDYCQYNDTKGMNSDEYLTNLSIAGLNKRLNGKVTLSYKERLLKELDIIQKMGFANYFLIVYDFVKYAKTHDILVGPGRGSAAGSLVSFSLGIIDVDPVKYELLFERFLNPERVTMPDIDIDFPDDLRDDIIRYVEEKYGKENVSMIITFDTFGSRMAIRDMGRVMNVPLYTIDALCKKIGEDNLALSLQKNDVHEMVESDNKLKKLYQVAMKIEGMPRHSSIHASGVIISSDALSKRVPLVWNNDYYICGYEKDYLEELGLLKMDFLSLKNLTLVNKMLNLIKEYKKEEIKFNEIPLDDDKTNSLFQNGDTLGIFQFEKEGMKSFLMKLHPDNFEDIYNANAFYRPGPSMNIDSFIRRKKGLEKIDYFDERLESILKSTKGIIVYQEQIMLIANKMANFSMGEADILRRAMSKKNALEIEKFRDKFISNATKNGYELALTEKIFNYILNFAGYGFNKSHSVAYSMLSYRMAYIKAHEPLYFYLAMLDSTNLDIYIKEMKKHQIKVLKPDINKSTKDFSLYYDKILLPLHIIKGISGVISEKIIDVREDGFKDIYDFFRKIKSLNLSKNILLTLIDAGTFDSFNYNRMTLAENLESLLNYSNLVNELGEDFVLKPEIILHEEYDKNTLIMKEKETYGFYLSNHPVTFYKEKEANIVNLIDIKKYFNKNIKTVLMIDYIRETTTKKGEKMAFLKCSDEEDSIDVIVFPKVYNECNKLEKNAIIKIEGKVERRDREQIIANKIIDVKETK